MEITNAEESQEFRHTADYRDHDLGERLASRALRKAREFVNTVKGGFAHG